MLRIGASGSDPVHGYQSALTDFPVAGNNSGLFSLSQGDGEGIAKGNRMGGFDPGGGYKAGLIREHRPDR